MPFLRSSALGALLFVGALTAPARASVGRAVLFDELVRDTSSVCVGTPMEQRSVWEDGRIYTYTRVHVERPVAGELGAGADAWVRTLGGIVGKVGHSVDGEPGFTIGRRSMLFLHPGPLGAFEVTARAQGQFPVIDPAPATPGGVARIVRSATVGALFTTVNRKFEPFTPGAQGLRAQAQGVSMQNVYAADVLHDRPLDDAAAEVARAWGRTHGQ